LNSAFPKPPDETNESVSIKNVEYFEKQRGVCWVAGPNPISEKDFLPLVKANVKWINQTPFAFQKDLADPNLVFFTEKHVWWGERDEGIRITTKLANKFGIKTMLKPHIWLHRSSTGGWRAEIAMENEESWQQWFDNYRKFILHHAALAQANKIEIFCIGTELYLTIRHREADWRKLIKDVREIYHGKITYAANWHKEFEEVKFWDQLDFIGIQAYFPLSNKNYPQLKELIEGWQPHIRKIEEVQKRYQKSVIFTELGYKSVENTASKPWEWIRPFTGNPNQADLKLQANCYEAFFQSLWEKKWFNGVYFWKWFPEVDRSGGRKNRDFSPQDKPAEKILAKWFSVQ
jgi:hypothetical protein